jgi:hypothetical protein
MDIIDRTKDAITTNNTKPRVPEHPKVRTPAAGPLISTGNTKPAEKTEAEKKRAAKK